MHVEVLLTVSPFRPFLQQQPRVFSQQHLSLLPNLDAALANSTLSVACRLLVSLCSLFRARSLCFQRLADSFLEIPGVWVSRTILRDARGSRYLCDNSALSASRRYHFLSICTPFLFMALQIPFSSTHLFSHPYKTPGGVGGVLLPNSVFSAPLRCTESLLC
jgi:hypothetical protein